MRRRLNKVETEQFCCTLSDDEGGIIEEEEEVDARNAHHHHRLLFHFPFSVGPLLYILLLHCASPPFSRPIHRLYCISELLYRQ